MLAAWGGRGDSAAASLKALGGSDTAGHHSSGARRHLEVRRPDHHGCGLERVARSFPVVPLNPVELICVLPLWVVHSVQVGRTACIKPPACGRQTQELGTGEPPPPHVGWKRPRTASRHSPALLGVGRTAVTERLQASWILIPSGRMLSRVSLLLSRAEQEGTVLPHPGWVSVR